MTFPPPGSRCRAAHPGRPVLPPAARPAIRLASTSLLLLGAHLASGAELADCRAITDDRQRLACYDGIASQQTPANTTPEALFGLEAQQSAALLQERLGEEPVEALEQVVSTVAANRYGKLRISLANGQVWVQVDSDRLTVKAGDTVVIRRAALGSFLLARQGGGRSIRVRRAEAGP